MKAFCLLLLITFTAALSAQSITFGDNPFLDEIRIDTKELFPQNNFKGTPVKQLDSIVFAFTGTDPYFDTDDIKYIYQYDASFNLINSKEYEREDPLVPWEFVNETTWTYDVNNNIIEHIIYYSWNQSNNSFDSGYKFEHVYNNNNNITERTRSEYANGTQVWEFVEKNTNTYNTAGLEIEKQIYEWNNAQWQLVRKFVSTYNTSNLKILWEFFNYNSPNWAPYSKTEFTYNSNDELIERLGYRYNSGWDNSTKDVFTYSQGTNIVAYTWNNYTSTWGETHRYELLTDQNDNLTASSYYTWNNSLQSWNHDIERTYSYDNNYPYSVLAAGLLTEQDCRHLLIEGNFKQRTYYGTTLEQVYTSYYYWSDVMPSNTTSIYSTIGHSVYPNPVSDILTVDLPQADEPATIELFNASGQRVLSTTLTNNRLQIKGWAAGFYSYLLRQGGKVYSGKVIVE